MSFVEERFNTEIRYGMVGGAEFLTSVVTVTSGFEQRNSNWLDARGSWQVGDDLFTRAETDAAISFFRARRGKKEGFRFKDWSDFVVKSTNGILVKVSPYVYQLSKRYSGGVGASYIRPINKPVAGTFKLYNGFGTLYIENTDYTLNYTTGLVTFSGIATIVNTVIPVGTVNLFLTGKTPDLIAYNPIHVIAVDTAKPLVFSSNNAVAVVPNTDYWTGEFDVPVRFDTDKFNSTFEAYRDEDGEALFSISGLTVIELRV